MQDHSSSRAAYTKGVLLLVAAAALWSINGALIKHVYAGGTGPSGVVIAFYRSLFAGLVLLPLARGNWPTLLRSGAAAARGSSLRSVRPAAIACVIFFTLMTVCFVVANLATEAANAIILQYTSTFWIFLLSPVLLGEKASARDIWILALAIVGIAIIFVGNASSGMFGLLNGLGSGLFFGLLTMMIRRLRNSDPAAVTVFNNLGSAVLILPVVLIAGGLIVAPSVWFWLVFMGVVQFGIPYYLFSLGLARVPAHQAALITLLEPVLNPVWTYVVVGETVPPATLAGGGVILVALAIYALVRKRPACEAAH